MLFKLPVGVLEVSVHLLCSAHDPLRYMIYHKYYLNAQSGFGIGELKKDARLCNSFGKGGSWPFRLPMVGGLTTLANHLDLIFSCV